MDGRFESLCGFFPRSGQAADWEGILQSGLAPWLEDMQRTPQDPIRHGEGDVLMHTKLVCEALTKLKDWQALTERQQRITYLAALLHDVGKPARTRKEDGRWSSPGHARVGDVAARTILWESFGLCGCAEAVRIRETVCALVRWHMLPMYILERGDPLRTAIRLACIGEQVGDFSLELLAHLAEADVRGRVAPDVERSLEQLQLFVLAASEAGCFTGPYSFCDAASRFFYLSERGSFPGQRIYDPTWGEVIMLSGLPGTGKDTYIAKNLSELPVVSLDAIRHELGISPRSPQGKVISSAEDKAKEHLRAHRPFVLNATNLSEGLREKWSSLFHRYGASVKILYLETDEATRLLRNRNRHHAVQETVVSAMRQKLTLPMPWEAESIEWKFT